MEQKQNDPSASPTSSVNEDMVNQILAKRMASGPAETTAIVYGEIITNENFFTDVNPSGGMSIDEFCGVILHDISKTQRSEFGLFLQKLNDGEKLSFKSLPWSSSSGLELLFATFKYKRGDQPFAIPVVGRIIPFLEAYVKGTITLQNVSFDGLCKVVMRS